jgi:hypothetical protein
MNKMEDEIVIKGPGGTRYRMIYTPATFEEMAKGFFSLLDKPCQDKDIEEYLSTYKSIPFFVHNYFRSSFYYHAERISEAAKSMDLVLEEMESEKEDVAIFLAMFSSFPKKVYGLAGEIYANNDEAKKALLRYQDYEVMLSMVKSSEYPEGLLSFRPINEYSLADIINNEITVCSPRVMNDPYDTLLLKWGEFIRDVHKGKKHVNALTQSFESYRIRSFCRMKDKNGNDTISKVLMWSHYADNHKGFCIQYKFSNEFIRTEGRFTSRFRDIIYHSSEEPFDLNLDSLDTDKALCTKLNDWEYENEVRLITYAPDRSGEFLSIPIDEKSTIESVYFGYRCPDKKIQTIKNALSNYPEIKYFQMRSNYNDIYRLNAIPV